jgi:hypothetical protein
LSVGKILLRDKPKKQCRQKEKCYTKQEFDKTKREKSSGEIDN